MNLFNKLSPKPFSPRPVSPAAGAAWLVALLLFGGCASDPPRSARTASGDLVAAVLAARDLAEELKPREILVVFDLDNTLLAMDRALGSDDWYRWQRSLGDRPGCVPGRVPELLKAQGALYYAGSMHATQANAGALVQDLQNEGFIVIALTARGHEFRLPTFRELRRNRLDFSRHAIVISDPEERFAAVTWFPPGSSRPVHYEEGVMMVAGQHKGEMLRELIARHLGRPLKAVVAIDDQADNIAAFESSLAALGLPYRLFLYTGGTDNAPFPADEAAADWQRVAPALKTLQDVYGDVHYDMPDHLADPACESAGDTSGAPASGN